MTTLEPLPTRELKSRYSAMSDKALARQLRAVLRSTESIPVGARAMVMEAIRRLNGIAQ